MNHLIQCAKLESLTHQPTIPSLALTPKTRYIASFHKRPKQISAMLGSPILEVVLGLIFIYLLFSLLSTVVNELVASLTKLRANNLKEAVKRMLDDKDVHLSNDFYRHPLVKYMARRDKSIPSYIEPKTFAKVVSDILKTGRKISDIGRKAETQLDNVSEKIDGLGLDTETTELLKSFAKEAGDNWDKFNGRLETWFNETMDRATGWYVRKLKVITFVVGLLIAVLFNVDTLQVYSVLSKNADVREEIVRAATVYATSVSDSAQVENDTIQQDVSRELGELLNEQIDPTTNILGIGWKENFLLCIPLSLKCMLLKLVGWLITALAISLGAPFWFDLLNKLVKLRGTGSSPDRK